MSLTFINIGPTLEAAVRRTVVERDGIKILVAGTGDVKPHFFTDVPIDEWERQLADMRRTSLAAVATARLALAERIPARIVFVVHPTVVRAIGGSSLAAMFGAFLSTFAQVAAIELTGHEVTANVVVAGWTEENTPGDVLSGIPAGRYARDEELARAIAYFVSDDDGYTSGASLTVDGGFVTTKVPGGSPLLAGK